MVRASDQRASWASKFGGFYEHRQLKGDLGADPECTGGITYLIRSGKRPRDPPRRSWTTLTGERDVKTSPRSLLLTIHIFTGRFSRNSVKICTKFHQADP